MKEYCKRIKATNELPEHIQLANTVLDGIEHTVKFKNASLKPGVEALHRLLPIAQGNSGQSCIVALFLLSCYDTFRFSFPLSEFRLLDLKIYQDCVAVLNLNWSPAIELHCYFENGSAIFEELAARFRPKSQNQEHGHE